MIATTAIGADALASALRMVRAADPEGPVRGPCGGLYLVAVVRVVAAAPACRVWERGTWVEDGVLRGQLATGLSLRALGPHSGLQEPHGGDECMADSDSSRGPLPIWETLARQDGPRRGRGTLSATLLVHAPRGGHLIVAATVSECALDDDLCALLAALPGRFSGLDPYRVDS
ncbi:hypothetical protein [Embleya sp. NPDC005971]|uniref:hypothetical protein n=1 Tax=Embleya sp. NPDC005971 TaxID=3156724 RepID=UPI0033E038C5